MSKPYAGPWVLRTLLFVGGDNRRYIQKAPQTKADCIVLDLEDAVADHLKAEARSTIAEVLAAGFETKRPVFVRINPLETGWTLTDLDSVACANLSGFVYPKAYGGDDIKAFDAQLSLKEKELGLEPGHFDIIVLIETPQAVLNAYEIAKASSRVVGLLFGCEDYLTDMQGTHGPDQRSLLVPRHLISMAARAAGVVPIDTPYVQVHDEEGLELHIKRARELGFEGMLAVAPRQIEAARRLFTPSQEEVKEAMEMVRLAEDAAGEERSIAMRGETFISPPTLKRARKILELSQAMEQFEKNLGR